MPRNLYIDAQAVRSAVARLQLEHPELAEDAELLADTLEGQTDLHAVLSRIVQEELDTAADIQAIKLRMRELAHRCERFETRRNGLRSLITSLMEAAGQTKVKLPEATLSMANGRVGCVVTDEAALPDAFVRIERVPLKKEILDALKAGQDVPGVALRNGNPSLTVRAS